MRLLTTKTVMTILLSIFLLSACSWFAQEEMPELLEEEFSEHSPNIFVESHRRYETSRTLSSVIGRLDCSQEEDSITFTITNRGLTSWSLDRAADPEDDTLMNVRVFFNNDLVNTRAKPRHLETNEQLFGPNQHFSENCNNRQTLRVNTSVTCTLQPVNLQDTNTLRIQTDGDDDQIIFRCEQ